MHQHARLETVEYRGIHGKVSAFSSICDNCGIDLADATDALHSRREWIRFKKQVDGVPSGQEIAAMRKARGLNQQEAASLFGGGVTAFSKYENDDVIPDEAMVGLLKLAIAFPDTVLRLRAVKQKPHVLAIRKQPTQPIMWEEDKDQSPVLWPSLAGASEQQQCSVVWNQKEQGEWMQ